MNTHNTFGYICCGNVPISATLRLMFIGIVCFLISCEDIVEVELPKSQLTGEAVFEDRLTASAALADIYTLMRNNGLLSGNSGGLGNLMGLYADELDYYSTNATSADSFFYNHGILATNTTVATWWNQSYNIIYATNALMKGVDNSTSIGIKDQNQLKGESLFIRAFYHFLLVELFGEIPYIDTTDYVINSRVKRLSKTVVYDMIIADLSQAADLLSEEDLSGERVRPYKAVAQALLARVYLYQKDWNSAEFYADLVLQQTESFKLVPDLNEVYLKNSLETIWQFKPGSEGTNTTEGSHFIFTSGPPPNSAISNGLIEAFEIGDRRKTHWLGMVSDGESTWYHANKYKQAAITPVSMEYSIVLKLAELYLIRSEARLNLGNIAGAQDDLNKIRNRAGLDNTAVSGTDDLMQLILQERRIELFSEQGHRWFDLKRTMTAENILSPLKSGWRSTDTILPIPETELLANPNLGNQNFGY